MPGVYEMRLSIAGVANQRSVPGPPGGSESTSIRHTAPFFENYVPEVFDHEGARVSVATPTRQ